MRWPSTSLFVLTLIALLQQGSSLFCHRCYSSMGGCGRDLNKMMFPWRYCGSSRFCVKVVEKWGSDVRITRECLSELMKTTRHRLRMPVLQRHGYCENARVNDPYNPGRTSNPDIQYCFCRDFDGCNAGTNLNPKFVSIACFATLTTFIISFFRF